MESANNKTPVSLLQELMQSNGFKLPNYILSDTADSNGLFFCKVFVNDILEIGYGKTKKLAKHDSASKAITQLQNVLKKKVLVNLPSNAISHQISLPLCNYVGKLNEFCSKNSLSYPVYEDCVHDGHSFIVSCSLNGYSAQGKGDNKKAAKQDAASLVLKWITNSQDLVTKLQVEKACKLRTEDEDIKTITEFYKNLRILEKKVYSNININEDLQLPVNSLDSKSTLDFIQEPVLSEEEQIEKLKQMGIESYSISVYYKNPIVLIFKTIITTGNNFTLIQDGDNYNHAKEKLLANAVKFIALLLE